MLRSRLEIGAGLAALAAACGGDGASPVATDGPDVTFDRRAMLAHLADHLLIPTYEQFATDAAALTSAMDAHCSALAAGEGAATWSVAQTAWSTAMDTWETAEAVLVGPAAQDDGVIRNRIYAWPLVAPCAIDRDVVLRWAAPTMYDVTTRLDNARSLSSVEYLLFRTASEHNCVTAPSGWDDLGADLPRARCALAASIAADVAAQGRALFDAWRVDGGNYRTQLTTAGTSTSAIASEREAVNMVSDGLFYVDKMVKDMKLGESAGITVNACGEVDLPCLREVEHPYADRSSPAIRINLRALRAAFTGTTATVDGPSFDDYLRAVGAVDVADRMTAAIDTAIAVADAMPDGFIDALTSDRPSVIAVHTATKAITDDFKSQFLTVLGLDIPDDVAGDND